MHRRVIPFALLTVLAFALASPAPAGILDAVKQKVKDRATKKASDATDKGMDDAEKAAGGKGDKSAAESKGSSGETKESGAAGAQGAGTFGTVSTKFDFVPGDSVLLYDDFTQDELGEFPAKWKLLSGTFEVADMEHQRWLRCTSNDGEIQMKSSGIPDLWTLEFDFYGVNLQGAIALTVTARTHTGQQVWMARFPYSGANFNLVSGSINTETPVEGTPIEGRHHVMFLGRGAAVKAYMDRERFANVPDVSAQGTAQEFVIRLSAPGKPMIGNVRFAQGPRPPKDLLAEGKLVTHGILFDTGSDVVLPESAPVLRQVAGYMGAHADVKLKITGHTDNVGSKDSNLDLSKRRAASVAKALSTQFGVSAERLQSDGKGDTQPVSTNAKPEGRAMNRRVEFAKL